MAWSLKKIDTSLLFLFASTVDFTVGCPFLAVNSVVSCFKVIFFTPGPLRFLSCFWVGCMAKLFTTSSKGISVSAQWIVGNSIHILDRSAILMHRCESRAPCEDRCGPLQISTIFCCLITFVANGLTPHCTTFVVVPLSPIQSDFLNVISSFVPFW